MQLSQSKNVVEVTREFLQCTSWKRAYSSPLAYANVLKIIMLNPAADYAQYTLFQAFASSSAYSVQNGGNTFFFCMLQAIKN